MHTVQGDISQAETAQRIVEETLDRFGRIDTLVNNAGIFIGKPFLDYTYDDFAAMKAVNLEGFFHLTQRVVRHIAEQARGHVVNIGGERFGLTLAAVIRRDEFGSAGTIHFRVVSRRFPTTSRLSPNSSL